MNTAVATRAENVVAIRQDRPELIRVLGNSLYPGAKIGSIELVLGYCEAAGLDPMEKPVHIVPVWNSARGEMVDVIMPGVGLYRTKASRTGQFAGMTEPEFGDVLDRTFQNKDKQPVEMQFPEWCRVTVKRRLPTGEIAEFTAVERWLENYATDSGKSTAPNAMWRKRAYGQLAKCAQAQALRIAFPELGASPTAEEMEGKPMDPNVGDIVEMAVTVPPELLAKAQAAAAQGFKVYAEFFEKTLTKHERQLLQFEHDALKLKATEVDAERKKEAIDAEENGAEAEGGPTFGDVT